LKVSIITASFNRASTLVRTISSVKRQSYKNIQHIIVDGASNDNTALLALPMLGPQDIFQTEPDMGIYDAFNKGLSISDGDIVAFLHSDDLYFDDKVISQVVEVFSDTSIDVVYGDVCFFSDNNINKIKRRYRSSRLSKHNLAWGKMPAHPAIFIRKRIYNDIGRFKIDFKIAGDYEFLCRLVQYPNLRTFYLPNVLVKMQLGGISTGGLKNTIILNKEVIRALHINRIYTNVFMILSKYPSKILQFLKT
jgi:glycosyltransferase involved in cell wall biosynthesis